MQGYRSRVVNASGKRSVVFSSSEGYMDLPVTLPCGKCIGCRLERSRQWAIRCFHEMSLYENNCFITLTFNDDNLPSDGSLDVSVFQKFMKRLRKRFGSDIRFYHCGEYGEKYRRPHYHAILFNFNFPDLKFWKMSGKDRLYRSAILEQLWPFGYSSVGTASYNSAAYVARYIMKKKFGDIADEHYLSDPCPDTGLVHKLKPEYTTMSRRPGIGKQWFDMYCKDVYTSDGVVFKGKLLRPPKYYDSIYEVEFPTDMERVRHNRKINFQRFKSDSTPQRLEDRRICKERQLSSLVREVDSQL